MASTEMDVDPPTSSTVVKREEGDKKPRFEVKKVSSALGRKPILWLTGTVECSSSLGMGSAGILSANDSTADAIDIVVDNCAICRNHIMDLCELPAPSIEAKLTLDRH